MPTATDRDFLDMAVGDVRRVTRSGRDNHVVLLQEPQSGRRLSIWIGQETAIERPSAPKPSNEMTQGNERQTPPRPAAP